MNDWKKLLETALDDKFGTTWRLGYKDDELRNSRVTVQNWIKGKYHPTQNRFEFLLRITPDNRDKVLNSDCHDSFEEDELLLAPAITAEIYRNFMKDVVQSKLRVHNNLPDFHHVDDKGKPLINSMDEANLYGIDESLEHYVAELRARNVFLSVEGVGGIGKTTFVYTLARRLLVIDDNVLLNQTYPYSRIVWLTVDATPGIQKTRRRNFLNALADELKVPVGKPGEPLPMLRERIQKLLQQERHLIIMDNVEFIHQVDDIMPDLYAMYQDASIIITSREQLKSHYPYVEVYEVNELSLHDTYHLLANEMKKVSSGSTIECEQVKSIYHYTGGIPQALVLIAGMLRAGSSFETVIEAIAPPTGALTSERRQNARDKMAAVFTRIYNAIWDTLDEVTRRFYVTLTDMPIHGMYQRDVEFLIDSLCEEDGTTSESVYRDAIEKLRAHYILLQSGSAGVWHYSMHALSRSYIQSAFF